jgi:hypothetical protein
MYKVTVTTIITMAFLCLTSVAFAQLNNPKTGEPLVITCYRGTPTIDGTLSEWTNVAPAVVDVSEQVFLGADTWTGAADCSGKFYAMWDNANIYIAVNAADDKVVTAQTGGNIWMNDCAEIFFALDAPDPAHYHYQFGLTPNGLKWNWCNMQDAGQTEPAYVTIAAKTTATGYTIEASFPIAKLASLSIGAGKKIGFHPVLDDTDGDGSSRDLQITWTGREAHDQTGGFGTMIFSELAPTSVSPAGKTSAIWGEIKRMY